MTPDAVARRDAGRRRPRLKAPFAAVVACPLAFVAAPATARADATFLPGNSREIARTDSASRDVAVSDLVFLPRVSGKAAVDFAIWKIDLDGVALRPGMYAFFEVEHADVGVRGPLPLPGEGKGPMLWRGCFGFDVALSAERLAHAWLGRRGALEIVVTAGHESDHATGGSFDDAPRPGDITQGGGGNFILYEFAIRTAVAPRVDLWARVQDRIYFFAPILHAPGAEAGLRWHARPHLEPLASVFGEGLLVDRNINAARDGGFLGVLAGVRLLGRVGAVIPYAALDAGNGKGLLVNRRETALSIGVRLTPLD